MNEIFLLVDMRAPVVDDLRAIGVRVGFRAEVGKISISTILRSTSDWTPEFSRQVDEVLTRSGLRELREGVWGPPDTDVNALQDWEASARAGHQYEDIWRTMQAHPDWTDQEVAEACGVQAAYVTDLRESWDR
jgi:hypothetical protein